MTAHKATFNHSVVIPVYNGAATVGRVVDEVFAVLEPLGSTEVVLVNDGSADSSADVCRSLAQSRSGKVVFVNLSRNFGEHNAVLAGISHARGARIAIIDDDGQNPPSEIPVLLAEMERGGFDVVYGRYEQKQHETWRNLGSRFNDAVATKLIGKPPNLYLCSFKVINRFVADHLRSHPTPYPYIDSMIFQCTQNIGQALVKHAQRVEGRSNYNLRRLVLLWSNMLTTSSILPLRLATWFGLGFACFGFLSALAILVEAIFFPSGERGWASLAMAVVVFSGIQLFALGIVGEYVGRIFQAGHRRPFVVREVVGDSSS
ncbi:MAG: glycosyltransferase family 2 protein [Planctomycetota bacterium]